MLTAYDYTTAKILDKAGVDVILVGDSLGMVLAGLDNTIPVTLEQMIYHGRYVTRGVENALVIVDMPFSDYKTDTRRATQNAVEIIKKTGAMEIIKQFL